MYDRLVEKGWDVHKQVGCSGYRIDLAVVDPDAKGRYLLGVECDGANYHRAKTARDRDKLREGVLRDLGWQLHRVWSTDWRIDTEGEVAKIEAALVIARDKPAETPVATAAPPADRVARFAGLPMPVQETRESVPPPPPDLQQGLATYKAVPIDELLGSTEQFYELESDREIRALILRVVRQEGPVSLKVVARRVAASWGMGRVGSRILDRVSALVPRNVVYVDRERRGDVFLWPAETDREQWTTFRVPGPDKETSRDIKDISIVELANASVHVLRLHYSVPIDDLVRETARMFGFKRTGRIVEQRVASVVPVLIERGDARKDGDNLVAT